MALGGIETEKKQINPKVEPLPTDAGSITKYSDKDQLDSLIDFIDGHPWTVTYYCKEGTDTDPSDLPDPGTQPSDTQYQRIEDMVINVQDPIEAGQSTSIEGVSLFNIPDFRPKIGDFFKAKLADGDDYMFILTARHKVTYHNTTLYRIAYKLHVKLKDNPAFSDLLDTHVTDRYVYDKDLLYGAVTPVIREEIVKDIRKLTAEQEFMIDRFYKDNVNKDFNLVIPRQTGDYLDSKYEEFAIKIMGIPTNSKFTSSKYDDYENLYTVLDCLVDMKAEKLKYTDRNIGIIDLKNKYSMYAINYEYNLLLFEGIVSVDKSADTDARSNLQIPGPSNPALVPNFNENIMTQGNYLFSNDFYNNDATVENQPILEKELLNCINGRKINLNNLQLIIDDYMNWNEFEKFYTTPFIVYIIKLVRFGRYNIGEAP